MATQTELYRFSEQASGLAWTFTSGNEDVDYDAGNGLETYEVVSIKRTEAQTKGDVSRANIEVTVSLNNEAALRWMADNGEKIVTLTIFERDKGGTVNVVWKGRLASIMPGLTDFTLRMESVYTSLRRTGLRARYQRSCRHALYGRGCKLNPETFAVDGLVSQVNSTTYTIAEAALRPNGYYTGGMLRAPDGTLSYVIRHVGNLITVQRHSFALIEAANGGFPFAIKLYPGCTHDRATCNSKFNNLLNYGGFDFIPKKNPMGGGSIV